MISYRAAERDYLMNVIFDPDLLSVRFAIDNEPRGHELLIVRRRKQSLLTDEDGVLHTEEEAAEHIIRSLLVGWWPASHSTTAAVPLCGFFSSRLFGGPICSTSMEMFDKARFGYLSDQLACARAEKLTFDHAIQSPSKSPTSKRLATRRYSSLNAEIRTIVDELEECLSVTRHLAVKRDR